MGSEGEWLYRCNRCHNWLTKESFHSDKSKIFEISYTCKECRKNMEHSKPMLHEWEERDGIKVLENMGYDINGDIHKQFLERVKKKYGVVLT